MNERKLTKSELAKREDIIMKMKKNKRSLVQKYGKDAEAVMYGRATNIAKKQAEAMDQDKIKELVKDALQNPKKADLNKDGKLSDYEEKRGAAIEKNLKEWGSSDQSIMNQSIHRDLGNPTEFPGLSQIIYAAEAAVDFYWDDWDEYQTDRDGLIMSAAQKYARQYHPEFMAMASKMMEPIDEMDINDPVAMKMRAAKDKLSKMRAANAGDDGNDKFFTNSAKLHALQKKRKDIMRDMEQEAEMEGGPAADRYGDMLNAIDAEIAKQNAMMGLEEDLDLGHEDNEPHMLKADLYRIGKYAMELYQILDQFEGGSEEVDLPHWWQSKIIKSKDAIVGAKHYLDFEIKEPQIDAMVDVAQDVEAIDEFDDKSMKAYGDAVKKAYGSTPQAMFTDYSNKELAAYLKNNPTDKKAASELHKRSQKLKDLSRTDVKEGVWSLGSAKSIKNIIGILDMALDIKDPQELMDLMDMHDKSMYNIVGDDVFHDDIDGAKRELAQNNLDRAYNRLIDAKGRAEDLLKIASENDLKDPSIFEGIAKKLAQHLKSK